jgi:hypothetical protein
MNEEQREAMMRKIVQRWLEHPEILDDLLRSLQSDDIVEDWPMEGGKSDGGEHEQTT